MVGHHGLAARGIHVGGEFVADLDDAGVQLADMRVRGAALLRVRHLELGADVAELARITHLAAGLRIERCAIQHHFAFVARVE